MTILILLVLAAALALALERPMERTVPAVLAGALLVAVWNIGITVCLGGARVFEGLFLIAAVLYLQFTRKLYDRVKK